MSTLIAYQSRHGCAGKVVEILKKQMPDDEVALADLGGKQGIDLTPYDTIIIGGSIYLGSLLKGVRKFCERNIQSLLCRRVGLFICCMNEGETARGQLETAFSAELRSHATALGLFGGELDFEKMGPLEKSIIGQVVGITASITRIDENAIRDFARKFAPRQ